MSGIFGFKSNKAKAPLADLGFPVGSIFLTVNSANPSTYLGGTWVQIKDKFLLACGDTYTAGETGGESEVLLTGAQSGIKAHNHGFTQPSVALGSHYHEPSEINEYFITSKESVANNTRVTYSSSGNRMVDGSTDVSEAHFHHWKKTNSVNLGTKTATGGEVQEHASENATEAHNNMPPYLAVYVWQRTA